MKRPQVRGQHVGRTPWLPNVAVGTVGSAPGMSHLYSEGAGSYASGPLQLQLSLIMALQSWPGMECSRRLRSPGATRPHYHFLAHTHALR